MPDLVAIFQLSGSHAAKFFGSAKFRWPGESHIALIDGQRLERKRIHLLLIDEAVKDLEEIE